MKHHVGAAPLPQSVEDIHMEGGTVLGTCETGECDVMAVVKMLGGEGHWAGGTGHGAWGMAAQPGTRAAMRARS